MRSVLIYQRFDTWTQILNFLMEIEFQYSKFNINYEEEVLFMVEEQNYMVKIKSYGSR